MKITVHVRVAGLAMCGLAGLPRDWPQGHKWTGIKDMKAVTCKACKRAVREWKRKVRAL